ncbi:hypothetical protein MUJ63_11745 [Lachnospiraceae bacterium NSJ-143]|nr:hypothetical protein [Lachnospiraceae bacterium NSJ-143]
MSTISIILFMVGSAILCLCLLLKHSNFLDIRRIFVQHFCIFKGNPLQLIGIFFAPILLTTGLVEIKCIDKDILSNLNIILSILTAMFLSILSILCSFNKEKKNENYEQLLKETFNTVIFEITLCLLLLFISFIVLFIGNFKESIALKISSGIIYYLTMVTILNILVVIKRIKVLFDNQ